MSRRRVALFTSTRADLWPLLPVSEALLADGTTDVSVFAAGSHVFAGSCDAGGNAWFRSGAVIALAAEARSDSPVNLVDMAAASAAEVSRAIGEVRPDVLVVLGDRYELLGVALAATVHRVPLAHLHGGEITVGAIDDGVRHAVTKLAHLHFCATEEYAERVRSMGEEPWRVHVTGAPGIDRLQQLVAAHTLDEVEAVVGHGLRRPFGLVTYHPPTARPDDLDAELEAIVEGCDQLASVVVTAPGADAGAAAVIARMRRWEADRPGSVTMVSSLDDLYPIAMASADVVVGNSSSGIIEAPSLGVPVVNVGSRQEGRVRAASILDVPGDGAAVRAAVANALAHPVGDGGRPANPYGDGGAGRRIAEILSTVDLAPLLAKRFVDAR